MRFIIFAAIGPLIGVILLHVAAAPWTGWTLNDHWMIGFIGAVVLGYVMGLGPLLLVAVLDWWLERRGVNYRVTLCAVFGFLACFLLGQNLTNAPGHFLAAAGIAGAISAAACSWLSGVMNQGKIET